MSFPVIPSAPQGLCFQHYACFSACCCSQHIPQCSKGTVTRQLPSLETWAGEQWPKLSFLLPWAIPPITEPHPFSSEIPPTRSLLPSSSPPASVQAASLSFLVIYDSPSAFLPTSNLEPSIQSSLHPATRKTFQKLRSASIFLYLLPIAVGNKIQPLSRGLPGPSPHSPFPVPFLPVLCDPPQWACFQILGSFILSSLLCHVFLLLGKPVPTSLGQLLGILQDAGSRSLPPGGRKASLIPAGSGCSFVFVPSEPLRPAHLSHLIVSRLWGQGLSCPPLHS